MKTTFRYFAFFIIPLFLCLISSACKKQSNASEVAYIDSSNVVEELPIKENHQTNSEAINQIRKTESVEPVTPSGFTTSLTYDNNTGVEFLNINFKVKNNKSNKIVTALSYQLIFSTNKNDYSAETETKYGKIDVVIAGWENKEVTISVVRPEKLGMSLSDASLTKVYYSDGTLADLTEL